MKKLILLFVSLFLLSAGYAQKKVECPIKGDNANKKKQYSDSLKNRAPIQLVVDTTITLAALMQPGNDVNRFTSDKYVAIEGYVVLVKYGGGETCNCHSTGQKDSDIHIELSLTPNLIKPHVLIAEVTRFSKDSIMTYDNVRSMVGKKVKIYGYLFFDDEHKQNALNTSPEGAFLWRATCWEVHPVCKIEIIK